MTEADLLAEIFSIYKPESSARPVIYRAYYKNNEIICFSQEYLDMDYFDIPKDWYETFRPELFEIVDGTLQKKKVIFRNKQQIIKSDSPTDYATLKNNKQIAINKNSPYCDYWMFK